MATSKKTVLWKDTTTDLNNTYRELIRHFERGDYAVTYLHTFEMILSLNLPDTPLHMRKDWQELNALQPLPMEPKLRVTMAVFANYLWYYENVMREVGLIDKDPLEMTNLDDVPAFDGGGA